jgi:hypothetical protein
MSAGHSVSRNAEIPGAIGVRAGEHHEQRCRIDAAVIATERHLAQRRHLALARLVHDLAGAASANDDVSFAW